MDVLISGFGRMGLSHALQVSGLLGQNAKFFVVDPSRQSRAIANALLPDAQVITSLDDLPDLQNFDFGIVCSPPGDRTKEIDRFKSTCGFFLVEKPIGGLLPERAMSGYVMQHCPILEAVCENLAGRRVERGLVKVQSNIDFRSVGGWRGHLPMAIAQEFFGHAATFLLTPVYRSGDILGAISNIRTLESSDNIMRLEFEIGSIAVELNLMGGMSVRKTTYLGELWTENHWIEFSPYELRDDKGISVDITEVNTAVGFYLRGFEFCRQASRLINRSGDVLPRRLIYDLESLIVSS